jgi:alanine racemase
MRPAWLEIRPDALIHNFTVVRSLVGPQVKTIAVVKGNGYGHGLVETARALAAEPVTTLAVAIIEEAVALREAGIEAPILVLGTALEDAAETFVRHNITATVSDVPFAESLSAAALEAGRVATAHVKIDSGMGRQGCGWREADFLFQALEAMPNITVNGVFTHFACATDPAFTHTQLQCFLGTVKRAELVLGKPIPLKHAAASLPIVTMPETYLDAVRPGIILYGGGFPAETIERLGLEPALSLKAKIVGLKVVPADDAVGYDCTWRAQRDSRIALLSVGYADGYPRALSNNADALLHGRRVPIVGRVSMDCITVDVTDLPGVHIGDEAVLIGRQGEEAVSVDEIARRADTVPQEILSRLGSRLPRVYR